MENKRNDIRLSSLKITLIYVIVAGLWIALSDHLLDLLVSDSDYLTLLQTYKGWFYVFITGLGLFFLIKKHDNQLTAKQEKQKEAEQKLKRRQERLQRSQKIGNIGDWELNIPSGDISWSQTMFDIFERDPELGPPSFEKLQTTHYYKKSSAKHNEAVQKAIKQGKSFDIDLELETEKGNHKYIRVIGIPSKKEGQNNLWGIVQDITNQIESQKELKQRNDFIETALENLPIGVAVNTIDEGELTLMNKRFTEIYGWPKDVLNNVDNFFEKVFPDEQYREIIKSKFLNDTDSADPDKMQWDGITITTPEGEKKIVDIKNIPLYEQNQMITTVMDVTNLKYTEEELRKEKQRFELVANTTTDVIWDYDPINETLSWSKGFEKVFGYNRDLLSEDLSSWTKHIYPDDKEEAIESFKEALNSNNEYWQHEYRYLRADGSITHIIDRGKIIRDDMGKAIRVVGTLNDISKRKQTEQKLRESEEKYRHIFENNPEPMWIYNPETLEFVEVNRAAVDHYGYSKSEFLDMKLTEIRPSQDVEKLKKDVKKHQSKKTYFGEWRHLKKDGTLIYVEITAANIQYKENTFRLALIHDITEQKQLQKKVIQSIIEGEDRERKRIAHELHDGLVQYLVAANMNFQTVKNDIDMLPGKRRKQFETGLNFLKKGLEETRSIAHNLMPKAISDYGLLAALEDLIHDHENSTDITFHFNHNCQNLQLKNQAEINIYRIFQELISNSVKHSECSTIRTELKLEGDKLKILIADDGKGAAITKLEEDRGIGIRSVKTRANSLKGSLNFESRPGAGMKISITIPKISRLTINNGS